MGDIMLCLGDLKNQQNTIRKGIVAYKHAYAAFSKWFTSKYEQIKGIAGPKIMPEKEKVTN